MKKAFITGISGTGMGPAGSCAFFSLTWVWVVKLCTSFYEPVFFECGIRLGPALGSHGRGFIKRADLKHVSGASARPTRICALFKGKRCLCLH